jgi:hypothetical protein
MCVYLFIFVIFLRTHIHTYTKTSLKNEQKAQNSSLETHICSISAQLESEQKTSPHQAQTLNVGSRQTRKTEMIASCRDAICSSSQKPTFPAPPLAPMKWNGKPGKIEPQAAFRSKSQQHSAAAQQGLLKNRLPPLLPSVSHPPPLHPLSHCAELPMLWPSTYDLGPAFNGLSTAIKGNKFNPRTASPSPPTVLSEVMPAAGLPVYP